MSTQVGNRTSTSPKKYFFPCNNSGSSLYNSQMAACTTCGTSIRWMDTFPGDICVNCHRANVASGTVSKVQRIQDLRRSNAAGPTNSKKSYKRKAKNRREAENE